MKRYAVLTASACMPSSCWGAYGRIGVVELEEGFSGTPKMLSERARGVARVVETWESLHIGRTERCAFQKALKEAEALCQELNDA